MSVSPLSGLRVLDFSRLLPGPFCTLVLADFGAEVIMVEPVDRGVERRWLAPLHPVTDESYWHLLLNRGKKSLAVNLKDPRGRAALLRLAETADVLLEGFRPGVMKRLGLDYPTLGARNPRLVYCSLSGYGQTGGYARMAGHDLNFLALAGVLELVGPPDAPPAVPGVQIADLGGGGQPAVMGILLALMARARSGRGQYVDVAMVDGSLAWLQRPAAHHFSGGVVPNRDQLDAVGGYACYRVYACRDGRYLAIGALEAPFWANLCRHFDRLDLVSVQFDVERREEVTAFFQARFLEKTRDEWFAELRDLDVCAAPVRSAAEALEDPHFRVRGMVLDVDHPRLGAIRQLGTPIRLSQTPVRAPLPAPELGEHTDQVLRDVGYSDGELDALRAERVLR